MASITPNKFSFYMTIVCLACTLIGVFLSVLITKLFDANSAFFFLSLLASVYITTYYAFKKIMVFKQDAWGISLRRDGSLEPFEGGSFLRFYLGYVWRVMLLNAVTTGVLNNIDPNNSMWALSLFVGGASMFFAIYWLIKSPYGSVDLTFSATPQRVTPSYLSEKKLEESEASVQESSISSSSESFWDAGKSLLAGGAGGIFFIAYFLIGLIQLAAINDFFQEVWGWWLLFSAPAALFIAYVPVVGNIAGFYTAYTVWGWNFWISFILFFWPLVLMGGIAVFTLASFILGARK